MQTPIPEVWNSVFPLPGEVKKKSGLPKSGAHWRPGGGRTAQEATSEGPSWVTHSQEHSSGEEGRRSLRRCYRGCTEGGLSDGQVQGHSTT